MRMRRGQLVLEHLWLRPRGMIGGLTRGLRRQSVLMMAASDAAGVCVAACAAVGGRGRGAVAHLQHDRAVRAH